jgi:hypothetical protein
MFFQDNNILFFFMLFNVCILNICIFLLLKYIIYIHTTLNNRILKNENENKELIMLKDNLKIKFGFYYQHIIDKINDMKNTIEKYFDKINFNNLDSIGYSSIEKIKSAINESSITFNEYELDELVNIVDNYFKFFNKLNIDKKIFNSLFYINDEIKYKLLLFSNNDYVINNILHKYYSKYYDEKFDDFFPLPIKLLNKNFQYKHIEYFLKYHSKNNDNIHKNNINSIIDIIDEGKTNFIDLTLYCDNIFAIDKVKLLNETNIEYDIKIMKKIKEYFDTLYLIYQKYEYLNFTFESTNIN